ncbi:hypothetical protein [Sphingomonas glacialis]|uniref:hypothetical protein n=1 Tax=Sphingomonas glacialis TaxID=658225 RepID=UPI00167839A3|nr:hypothetical protein [Sphingomonas glacialis]
MEKRYWPLLIAITASDASRDTIIIPARSVTVRRLSNSRTPSASGTGSSPRMTGGRVTSSGTTLSLFRSTAR